MTIQEFIEFIPTAKHTRHHVYIPRSRVIAIRRYLKHGLNATELEMMGGTRIIVLSDTDEVISKLATGIGAMG